MYCITMECAAGRLSRSDAQRSAPYHAPPLRELNGRRSYAPRLSNDVAAPSSYRRTPWKNGGGVTIDIAAGWKPGAVEGDWSGMLWRFGRTSIISPGPFSDLSGYDRAQVVVEGRGLALETPDGRDRCARADRAGALCGETPIISRLEQGPVEVVNLIGARDAVAIDLRAARRRACDARTCAPRRLRCPRRDGSPVWRRLVQPRCGHALQIETELRLLPRRRRRHRAARDRRRQRTARR